MKIVIYSIILFFGGLLFLPRSVGSPIRNIPLLLTIIIIICVFYLVRFIKYVVLILRTKKFFKQRGMKLIRWSVIPDIPWMHGYYNMTFKNNDHTVNILFMVKKQKYQHYYFESTQKVEFYKYIRQVFNSSNVYGPKISNHVENKLIGKQKLLWREPAEDGKTTNILLFDKLPPRISDSQKREDFGNGDCICSSNIYLYDVQHLLNLTNIP